MSPRPAPPADLAGRWLTKFFTDHLAGERAASARTIASYRDAMKLMLTWFNDVEQYRPRSCALSISTAHGSCGSWAGWRPNAAARRPPATSASR
jgi:hypothetical protein